MNDILVRLKYLLNSYSDEELKDMELWIDSDTTIDIIALDENAIDLITDSSSVKINNKKW